MLKPTGRARFERIARYYETLIDRYGHSPRACDYGRPESQTAKFEALSQVARMDGMTLLDVGCGFADYAGFLKKRSPSLRYTGIDITHSMIERARSLHPKADIRISNLLALPKTCRYDIVSANGIFYLLGDDAFGMMERMVRKMFSLSRVAAAFNTLSTWAPHQERGEFYADPIKTLAMCRKITSRVALRHDYLPHDFTVYLYHEPISAR